MQVPGGGRRDELVEREQVLDTVAELVERASEGAGATLVMEGPPGVGKTALLEATGKVAARSGFRVLRARAGELESGHPFGVVRQLFDPVAARLEGLAAMAAPVFEAVPDRIEIGEPTQSVLRGLYWMVAGLAERGPATLIVDDAHWADLASLRFIDYLARRVDDLPVVMAVAVRNKEIGAEAQLAAVRSIQPSTSIPLDTLSVEGTGRLLGDRFGAVPEADFVAAAHEITGGNPLLVAELADELRRRDIRPETAAANRLADILPRSVEERVGRRLDRLEPDERAMAQAVSILGAGASVREVAQLLGADPARVESAIDAMVKLNLLDAVHPPAFRHPLLRTGVIESIPVGRRSELHRAAAFLLRQDRFELSKAAAHLLSVEPSDDAEVVALLREAARESFAKGSFESAVAFLRRALEEHPAGFSDRPAILLDLGLALSATDLEAAASTLVEAAGQAEEVVTEARAARAAGYALSTLGRVSEALDYVESRLGSMEYRGQAAVRDLARMAAEIQWTVGRSFASAAQAAERYWSMATGVPEEATVVAGGQAYVRCATLTDFEAARRLALAAAHDGDLLAVLRPGDYGVLAVVVALIATDELDVASAFSARLVEAASRSGDLTAIANCSMWKAWVTTAAGDLLSAEADAELALSVARTTGQYIGVPIASLSTVLIERGEAVRAASLFDEIGLDLEILEDRQDTMTLIARAATWLSVGKLTEAARDLDRIAADAEAWGDRNPLLGWRALRVFSLLAGGHSEEATRLAYENLDAAREWGAPRSLSSALRIASRVEPDVEGRLGLLREAAEVIAGSSSLLERAKVDIALGSQLRRHGRRIEARDLLSAGWDAALRCSANGLGEFALAELVAAGARPRRIPTYGPESLTASERRVAEMAVAGKSNREIAEALFVTTRTVTFHLTSCYRKLGVSGRDGLAEALSR